MAFAVAILLLPAGADAGPEDVLLDIDKGIDTCFRSGERHHTDTVTYETTGWYHLYGEARITARNADNPPKQWGLTFVRHDGDTTGAVDRAWNPGKQYGSAIWFSRGRAGRPIKLRVWASGGPWCLEMTQLKVVPR